MKKAAFVLLAALLLANSVLFMDVRAAGETKSEAAERLYALGLLQGMGTLANGKVNLGLEDALTREQGVTMLVRLLGKEPEALKSRWVTPFSDVSLWAAPYVNYALKQGLARGTSSSTFGGGAPIDASQYVTFLLRALGYKDGRDFQWDAPWKLSDSLGLATGLSRYPAKFTRGDAAYLSWKALNTALRNKGGTLLDELIAGGSVKRTTSSTLAVCGDVMCHEANLADARRAGGGYSFTHMLAGGAPYVSKADYAVANLETTLAAENYTGYPCFRSPDALAYNLKRMGVDLLMTCNNHCLDAGYDGLARTLDVLDQAGLPHIGTSRSSRERQNHIRVADVGGISVAFLAYTYGTNGIPKPNDKPWCVNTFTTDYLTLASTPDEAMFQRDLKAAKKLGTDLIAVMIHWGVEYQTVQNSAQEKVADLLIQNGADIVLGGHPHVLQPMEMRTVTDENGAKRRGFVCFSLGNYISAQTRRYTDVTTVLTLELTRDNLTGRSQVKEWTYTPMLMMHTGTWQDAYRLLDAHAGSPEGWIQAELDRAVQDCHDILGAAHDSINFRRQ